MTKNGTYRLTMTTNADGKLTAATQDYSSLTAAVRDARTFLGLGDNRLAIVEHVAYNGNSTPSYAGTSATNFLSVLEEAARRGHEVVQRA